jgi:hypothetical protein
LHFGAEQKGRNNMNRYLQFTWFRNGLLLVALAAGGLLTQVMPTYEEMAALRTPPAAPTAASKERARSSGDVTGIDVDQRHMKTVQSTA